MKHLRLTVAYLAATATPALAQTDATRLGISVLPPAANWLAIGVDADLPLADSGIGVCASFEAGVFPFSSLVSGTGEISGLAPTKANLLGRYRLPVGDMDALSLYAGLNYSPQTAVQMESGFNQRYMGLLVGATYTIRSGKLWLALSPHYVFSQLDSPMGNRLIGTGIPFAEVGFAVTPSVDVSFRLQFTPVRVSWHF